MRAADEQQIRDSAIQQSIEIVRRRIDETGTREPTIQRQGENRIIVQLPDIDDPERVKSLLGETAKMDFHLADTRSEEHTSELQSLMRISSAVFCLKKKKNK